MSETITTAKPVKRIKTRRGLARAIKQVVLEEEHYNQRIWLSSKFFRLAGERRPARRTGDELREILGLNVCGTTACVAGTAIILTLLPEEKYDYTYDTVVLADETEVFAQEYAAAKMGLRTDEAYWLFHADRSREDVLAALDLLIAGRRLTSLMSKVHVGND